MAASTYACATGSVSDVLRSEEDRRLLQRFRKRKKTVYWDSAVRPLFACPADMRSAGLLRRDKDAVLVLFSDSLAVLCGSAMDGAKEERSAERLPALRLIGYGEIIDMALQPDNSVLEIEHLNSADSPQLAIAQLLDMLEGEYSSGVSTNSLSTTNKVSSGSTALPDRQTSNASSTSSTSSVAAVPQTPANSAKVTYETTTLVFGSADVAQEAAAALSFYRAQCAALHRWLSLGLHAGLRCQLAAVDALPLSSSAPLHQHMSQGSGPTLFRAFSTAADSQWCPDAACSGSSTEVLRASRYAWAVPPGSCMDWGCQVPLPQAWGDLLDKEVAAGQAAADGHEPEITAEDLNCFVNLSCGPQALLVTFSTPLGLAQAMITPQIARAALLNSSCRQVLAVPVGQHTDSNKAADGGPGLPVLSFQLTYDPRGAAGVTPPEAAEAAAAAMGATAVSGRGEKPAARRRSSGSGSSCSEHGGSLDAGSSPYQLDVFAALTVKLIRTPHTAGQDVAVMPLDPTAPSSAAVFNERAAAGAGHHPAAAPATLGAAARGGRLSFLQQSYKHSSSGGGGSDTQWRMLRMALSVVLASLLLLQLHSQAQLMLLQLLMLLLIMLPDVAALLLKQPAAAAAATMARSTAAPALNSSGPEDIRQQSKAMLMRQTSKLPAGTQLSFSRAPGAGGARKSAFAAAAAVATPFGSCEVQQGESPSSCGWSFVLVAGDVLQSPGQFLQLQVAQLSCSNESAELRSQLTFFELTDDQLPCLISQPEPAWLTADIKQRFINAKPTLEESQLVARATHEWRMSHAVDTVLQRPCPGFEARQAVMPVYILGNSPDGHAVWTLKGSGVRQVCDAIHRPAPGGVQVTLDHLALHVTLLNEYLVHVVAPSCLPGGSQIQVYDLAGLQLRHIMGEGMDLFNVLVRMGQYYPERLQQAIVVNAPGWFSIPFKIISQFLHPNTRAKVMVVSNPRGTPALEKLIHHMNGIDNVPEAWGGKCKLPLHEYPAHLQLIQYVRQLGA